jgi:putative transposase
MQVRWNYKLQPNKGQQILMGEWLVTLRKHRNYMLAERKRGYESNNQSSEDEVCYEYAAYCDLDTGMEVGAFCPLTCPVIKHGVIPEQLSDEQLLKSSKAKVVKDKLTGEEKEIPAKIQWDSVSGIQGKRTTQLRAENEYFARINSDVLQGNAAKLDAAYSGFFSNKRGFPAFRRASNFNSFQFKPNVAKLEVNRTSSKKRCYSHVYFPGIGTMRYLDSRALSFDAEIRTVTVLKEVDGWYMSVLVVLKDELPELNEAVNSSVGIDVGINKLVSLSDGSFIENPRFATSKKVRRQMRIRQRRVNRKVKGSKNRAKAGVKVAILHKQIADRREAYQWQAASKIVKTADVIVRENLNIVGMKSKCKPKRVSGRFMPNGQSAKRGLNRSISDAAWSGLFAKMDWLAAKSGKPVIPVSPAYTSQECSACHHVSKLNRDGEKFVCEECGHIDHADTQASRTINKRAGFEFKKNVRKDVKILPVDCGKVTTIIYESAPKGKRTQGSNRSFKAVPEKRILGEQLHLQFL